jgi:hypothetical protein
MASKKHSNEIADLNKAYEENEIGLKGILGFGIGLFLLIVVTFGLMWALFYKLTQYHADEQEANRNPMALSEMQRLPPEPRLQEAPGFGVDTARGRVNLELSSPQSEFHVLRDEWNEILKHGEKDPKTGTTVIMPIDEAKQKLLEQNVKAQNNAQAERFWEESRTYFTDQSAGRMASERRR